MSYLDQLPADVSNIIQSGFLAEFATVSAAGVPIDTPLVTFTSESLDLPNSRHSSGEGYLLAL